MNQFFRPKQTVFFFICCGICLLILLFTYAKLSLQPVTPVAQNVPAVERGSIVDRSGFPLAVQTNFYHVGVSVKNLKDSEKVRNRFAQDIAPLLEMLPEEILEIIDTNKSFVYLKKKISQTMYEPLKQLTDEKGYNFVSYEKIPGRNYPNHALASQLIGYMGDDGRGLAGIEFSQQSILAPSGTDENGEPLQGRNVFLSIDANLQYKLEQIAHKTMNETQAESMMLIAADCTTGEVLSYISLPSADLNEYGASIIESKS